jgi:aminopeptidase
VQATDLQQQLAAYGELAVKVALNLQPGQRLMILGPLASGVSFEAAPLVRHIAASAYCGGAPLVEVVWGDEALVLTRFARAPHESLKEFSAWLPRALTEHV